ncbi:Transcriptional regulator NanR [plant metagenome]|uniref:Transcriptional regulator NanR n=1 Tax=plant metagenome TaxID=1297885 RepID=A0A484RWK0_9ZZZZ
MPDVINRRKLYQEVADRLLARIQAGEFAHDARLPSERTLMEEYGVGRPAVREALFALEKMGIVEILHGERTRVTRPSPASVIQHMAALGDHMLAGSEANLAYLKDARQFFEVGMVRRAAERATEPQLAALRDNLRLQAAAADDGQRFLQADKAFHQQLAGISGNPIFTAVSVAMYEWLARYHVALVQTPGAEQQTLGEHQAIYDSVAAGDPDGAARAMTDHLTRANRLYQQANPASAAAGRATRRRA